MKLLDYEMKKRPEIAKIAAKVDTMTDQQIDALDTPLPWFKQAFRLLREKNLRARREAEILPYLRYGYNEDQSGDILSYRGETDFFTVDRGSQIEVRENTTIFRTQEGVWIDDLFSSVLDPRLIGKSTSVRQGTLSEYFNQRRAEVNANHTFIETPPLFRIERR